MRALVIVALLFALPSLVASRPARPPEPQVANSCLTATSLEIVTTCLRRFGAPTVLYATPTTKVIAVLLAQLDGGAYLYRLKGGSWILGGMIYSGDGFLGLESVTINRHLGYRIDFRQIAPIQVDCEDATKVMGTQVSTMAGYCGGDSPYCTSVVTACDTLVKGKAYRTFRGIVKITNNDVEVIGDRWMGGACVPPEHTNVSWE